MIPSGKKIAAITDKSGEVINITTAK